MNIILLKRKKGHKVKSDFMVCDELITGLISNEFYLLVVSSKSASFLSGSSDEAGLNFIGMTLIPLSYLIEHYQFPQKKFEEPEGNFLYFLQGGKSELFRQIEFYQITKP